MEDLNFRYFSCCWSELTGTLAKLTSTLYLNTTAMLKLHFGIPICKDH